MTIEIRGDGGLPEPDQALIRSVHNHVSEALLQSVSSLMKAGVISKEQLPNPECLIVGSYFALIEAMIVAWDGSLSEVPLRLENNFLKLRSSVKLIDIDSIGKPNLKVVK